MLNFLDDSRARAGFADAERQVRPRHGPPGQQAPEGGVLAQLLRRAAGIADAPVDAVLIERRMLEEGAVAASDFLGTSPEEAAEMWGVLKECLFVWSRRSWDCACPTFALLWWRRPLRHRLR